MATLQPWLAHPCCFKHAPTAHFLNGNKTTHRFDKLDMQRRLFCKLVPENVIRTRSEVFDSRVFATPRVSMEETEQLLATGTQPDEQYKASTYRFWTEFGDQVKVSGREENPNFAVSIEFCSFELKNMNDGLILSWGVFRGDSSCFMPLDFDSDSNIKIIVNPVETPFQKTSGKLTAELCFEAKHGPLYLSFLLKHRDGSVIRTHKEANFVVPVGFGSGSPYPLGLSFDNGFVNFAFVSRTAESVVLCLYRDSDKPSLELELDPYVNRSGDIWHASIGKESGFTSYGYCCKEERNGLDPGRVLLDPYAKIIGLNRLGRICKEPLFDWSGDKRPNLPMEELTVYRLNVKRFTEHESSQLEAGVTGTFSGLAEKLQHFEDLGINAILLEPVFQFDEKKGPYYPFHFFSPSNFYGSGSDSESAINSMKEMVKKLHASNMEVMLEVVFTHTLEGEAMRGIDDSYYYTNDGVLNCNNPVVQEMILDSLRYWVTEFHVDGFCFMNASRLLRGSQGESLSRPPLVEVISFDPILSKTKIIADFWDPRGLVDKETEETRFPHWNRWAEMNTSFCTDVRNFLGGRGLLSDLATRVCGSGDVFSDGRGPTFSLNFVTRNFGLSLVDLVSFSGSDDLASELSWNCGEEGPTDKTRVLETRLKQIRNFLLVLYVSLGIPVLNMGDEYGSSSGGSTAYERRESFNWRGLNSAFGVQITQFISFLSSLRTRRDDLLHRRTFPSEENISWHGPDQNPPNWEDPSCKFLAMTLKAEPKPDGIARDMFVAFNAADRAETVILPSGKAWHRLVDTSLPFPGFFSPGGELVAEQMEGLVVYEVKAHSCALFEAIEGV